MSIQRSAPARAAATAAVVLFTAAGCGARPAAQPEKPAAEPSFAPPAVVQPVVPPRAAGFDYADPSQVCARFAAAFFSSDTTRDAGPGDAFARASVYATRQLAAQRGAADHDGRWETWTAHRVRLEVHVEPQPEMHPEPDSSVEAFRGVRVTVTAVGADGWRDWTDHSVMYCTLRSGDSGQPGWRVAHYEIQTVRP